MEYQDKVNAKQAEVLELLTQKVLDLEEKLSRVIKLIYELTEAE